MSGYQSLIRDVLACGLLALVGAAALSNREALSELIRPLIGEVRSTVQAGRAERPGREASEREAPQISYVRGVELRADQRGHFTTRADINGRPVDVLVDTGATLVALSYEDAERAGVFVTPRDFKYGVNTANGVARVARVRLDSVAIGEIRVRDVDAVVSERGAMHGTLLGMSFLGKVGKVQMANGRLMLSD